MECANKQLKEIMTIDSNESQKKLCGDGRSWVSKKSRELTRRDVILQNELTDIDQDISQLCRLSGSGLSEERNPAASSSVTIHPEERPSPRVAATPSDARLDAWETRNQTASASSASHIVDIWTFLEHVAETCLRTFPATYFMCGITEECAEWVEASGDRQQVSEAGDVLWYVCGLWMIGLNTAARYRLSDEAGEDEGKKKKRSNDMGMDTHSIPHADMLVSLMTSIPLHQTAEEAVSDGARFPGGLAVHARSMVVSRCGRLAGSVKKYCRGDRGKTSWQVEFEARILRDIRELIFFLLVGLASTKADTTLREAMEEAMHTNILKIRKRYLAGKISGDNEDR